MTELLHMSKSTNTEKKYRYAFSNWKKFIEERDGNSIPSKHLEVGFYLTYLMDGGAGHSSVMTAVYAIKWFNELAGIEFNHHHPYIRNLMETAKRLPRKPIQRKDAVTSNAIIELCSKFQCSSDLLVLRDLCFITLCFAGFFRCSELLSLKANNLKFFDTHLEILLDKSKCDQYREGESVLIARGLTCACPVAATKKYFVGAAIEINSSVFIFRKMRRNKGICKLLDGDPISYTTLKKSVVNRLKCVNMNMDLNLGLHSLRAGGATQAVNAGVNDRCWKRHGRWATDSAKDRYVQDSLKNRLMVSKSLGL